MNAQQHRDYKEEHHHLVKTKQWARAQSEGLTKQGNELEHEIALLRKEVSSALDERLILKLQMQSMLNEDLDKMNKAKDVPYFGRINFQEKSHDDVEIVYIGKNGLYDRTNAQMLVLDWRAPMANIYYSGMDEQVSYRTPNGRVEGQMLLKRRYVMREGELTEIHDEKSLQDNLLESIAGDAGFLIESLNKSTKGRLTEIVATIQDQQNKIIRSDSMRPLIVQGVAGSGKTTIALHRMAYLIYNDQKHQDSHYMVVAPNKLFLNYIQAILPDLGVESVFQTTFEEWAMGHLEKSLKLKKGEDKLNQILSDEEGATHGLAMAAKLRGSIVFKKLIDIRLAQLERTLLPQEGVVFEGVTLFTSREINQLFLTSHLYLPLEGRIKQLGEVIKKRLKNRMGDIERGIMSQYQQKITTLKQSVSELDEVRAEIITLYDERDLKIKGLKKEIIPFVKKYIKNLTLPKAKDFYFDIYKDEIWLQEILAKQMTPDIVQEVITLLNKNYTKHLIETEDLGPLLYCQIKLHGLANTQKYEHIVVDEAQDLDEMKLTVLREVANNDAFTLVGDLSQGIYDYKGITNWERMMNRVFEGKNYHYHEMTTSYRSTIEIIDLANAVIQNCTDFAPLVAQPVLRQGDIPQLIVCQAENERILRVIQDLEVLQANGMHSIGILVETSQEAKSVYEDLDRQGQKVQWIQGEEDIYEGSVVVMTGALSKGLEFDAVMIYDVTAKLKDYTPRDIKLLYVMITRALHKLHMYAVGEVSPLLKQCDASILNKF
ncbi:MAG: RNA polymerase recycling motor HelD [Cellulosilyticaceae bacterium]